MDKLSNISNLGEIDVVYRYKNTLKNRPTITNSEESLEVLKRLFETDKLGLQEQFLVIFLNKANKVIGTCNMFKGGNSQTSVDVKLLLATALKLLASGLIVSHNHPSGNLKPSPEDQKLTKVIQKRAQEMGINVVDHLIVSPDWTYLSFADEGIL